jgi:DNA-binding response OmpR family regulator
MSSSRKILIVEDTLDTRELLHFFFTKAGYTVSTANDGQEGLYMAKAERPDLILTDISMPNVNGIEMIKQIRTDEQIADLPVIVFTALGATAEDEITEAGANRILYKPFDFDELQSVVDGMFRQPDSLP